MTSVERKEPFLSIIVPVYEHWGLARKLLNGLLAQTLPREYWEAVIVDNGSKQRPNFEELSKEFPGIHFTVCERAGSYAARNYAIERTKGDYLVFTDADCVPDVEWLKQLWLAIEADATSEYCLRAGGIQMVNFDDAPLTSAGLFDMFLGLPQERYARSGKAATANLTIPRAVVKEVGMFDDTRFSGGDVDFCLRAKQAGFKMIYQETAFVQHPIRNDFSELARKRRRIKGGQIKNGSIARRMQFVLRTFSPPILAYMRILRKPGFSISKRVKAIGIVTRLWGVEVSELFRLLFGASPERR